MPRLLRHIEPPLRRVLAVTDAAFNRLYGWRYNPIYQSGTIVVALFLVLLATGLWLLLFYRVGAPWASVARITEHLWWGNWVRGLHRYASDAAVLAIAVHAVRMFVHGRSWGPRTLAWVSGVGLLGLTMVCGWTGFVMVWDTFGQQLAVEWARVLDVLPVLSEPIGRAFVGERPIPGAFFFLNLFVHIAVPLALGLGLWLHVSRLARPTLLPPRRLMWATIGLLTGVAILWPLAMAPEASPFTLPAVVPTDWFFAFWLPISRQLPGGLVWAAGLATTLFLVLVPRLARRTGAERAPPSVIDEAICTGCRQCSLDCPYEAITMLPRTDGRADIVGRVDPALCVSCGICAGSCAPMGVGPAGRTGRDQLEVIRAFLASPERVRGEVVVIACTHGAGGLSGELRQAGAALYPVDCAGNLHTSVIEYAVRGGAGGVLILACPPRDCWNREGPRWLTERIYQEREAELQSRVDRQRIRVAHAGAGESRVALAALRQFQDVVRALDAPVAEAQIDLDAICEPAQAAP